ncbi:HAD hydrolase family protein [Thermoleophilia bacterium SCSIO 60948]|nr:HAD hydrolase family protein [Thermoleophilia bacterium SCSIO 60948]
MALRCVYTDLDGTLLGRRGSLFHDADGEFSMLQARALEACHRAGVEVVVMSGRREAQVLSDSRLMGQRSYIYEAGCAVVMDGEKTLLTGEWGIDADGREPYDQIIEAGIPELLFERFGPELEWHEPWHTGRHLSLLLRGRADVEEANRLIREAGHRDLRFLDNGRISTPVAALGDEPAHAYHLVPGGASKANSVAYHRQVRGYDVESTIAIGDSLEDLDVAASVGHFYLVANGLDAGPHVALAANRLGNVRITEGRMGDGFYEAVVRTLAER